MNNDPLDTLLDGMMPPELRRQSGERIAVYEHFLDYLRLGRNRGYGRLAKVLGMNVRTIERLAMRYRWHARAQAYDDLLANAALADVLRAALADAEAA